MGCLVRHCPPVCAREGGDGSIHAQSPALGYVFVFLYENFAYKPITYAKCPPTPYFVSKGTQVSMVKFLREAAHEYPPAEYPPAPSPHHTGASLKLPIRALHLLLALTQNNTFTCWLAPNMHILWLSTVERKSSAATRERGGGGLHVRVPAESNSGFGRHGAGHQGKTHVLLLGSYPTGVGRRGGKTSRGRR